VEQTVKTHNKYFGLASIICGGIALLMVVVHMWAGPLEPQKTIERTIAELAVNIAKEVANVARNKPAELHARSLNTDDLVRIAAATLAVLALVIAGIGFIKRENSRPLIVGAGLGAGAIAIQVLLWMALLIAGLVLIGLVVSNLGEILGTLGGG
jgi:hypothetical protein